MSDPILVDTNVLVYAHNLDSIFNTQALNIIKSVIEGRLKGVITHQNLLEFYSIITSSKRVSQPITPKDALSLIKDYLNSSFEIIYPNFQTEEILLSLCQETNTKGGRIFDAYLAATMLSNNIKSIVTLNTKDFRDFPDIKIIDFDS